MKDKKKRVKRLVRPCGSPAGLPQGGSTAKNRQRRKMEGTATGSENLK